MDAVVHTEQEHNHISVEILLSALHVVALSEQTVKANEEICSLLSPDFSASLVPVTENLTLPPPLRAHAFKHMHTIRPTHTRPVTSVRSHTASLP